jgi:hypothetical protein
LLSHTSSGKANGSKGGQTSSGTEGKIENNSTEVQGDGDGGDENAIYDASSWGEMERYNINLEEWILQNQESKLLFKLSRPTSEPIAKKDQVAELVIMD